MANLPTNFSLNFLSKLRNVINLLEREEQDLNGNLIRAKDKNGKPGGVITLPRDVRPVFVGDLHGRGSHLLSVMKEGDVFGEIKEGKAAVIVMGDAIHPQEGDLSRMESSLTLIKFIMEFKVRYPFGIYYLLGNHDPIKPFKYLDQSGNVARSEVSKGGVNQTEAMRERLNELGGIVLVNAYERFTELLPVICEGPDFIALHGGPPRDEITRDTLLNLRDEENFNILFQLIMNRSIYPREEGGYDKQDIERFRKVLDKPNDSLVIVGHTPPPNRDAVLENASDILNHTVLVSSHVSSLKAVTRDKGGGFITYPVRMSLAKPEEFL